MQLPGCFVEKAVAPKGEPRYYLQSPYLDLRDADKAYVVATTGNILIAAPVNRKEAEKIGDGLLPLDAVATARKNGGVLKIDGKRIGAGDGAWYDRPDGKFPEWRKVVPKGRVRKHNFDFAVNAELLVQVQRALCSKDNKWPCLELWFPCDKEGYVIQSGAILCRAGGEESGAIGLVMPMFNRARPFDPPKLPKRKAA